MAGAMFFINKMSILVESSGSRISSGSGGSPRIFSRATNVACVGKTAAVYCSMFGVTTSDDYRPVTWMGRYPVDITTILVGTHVFTLVAGCLLMAMGGGAFLNWLGFDSAAVRHGFAWHQLVTY